MIWIHSSISKKISLPFHRESIDFFKAFHILKKIHIFEVLIVLLTIKIVINVITEICSINTLLCLKGERIVISILLFFFPLRDEEVQEAHASSLLEAKRRGISRSALRSHQPVARPVIASLSRYQFLCSWCCIRWSSRIRAFTNTCHLFSLICKKTVFPNF